MIDNEVRRQDGLSTQVSRKPRLTREEKQSLVAKLQQELQEAKHVLETAEQQLISCAKTVESAKEVSDQAYQLVESLTKALNSANKTAERSKQAHEQSVKEMTARQAVVDDVKQKIDDLTAKLESAQAELNNMLEADSGRSETASQSAQSFDTCYGPEAGVDCVSDCVSQMSASCTSSTNNVCSQ